MNPTDDVDAAAPATTAGPSRPPRGRRGWTLRLRPRGEQRPPAPDGYTATLDALTLLRAQAEGDQHTRRRVLARYPMPSTSVGLLAAVVAIADRVGTSAGGDAQEWAAYLDRESARMIMRDLEVPDAG